jgi:hypothetical protein
MPLEKADISKLLASGWKPPMQIKMTAADGKTDIYGMLFRPTNFDPTRSTRSSTTRIPGRSRAAWDRARSPRRAVTSRRSPSSGSWS